MALSSERASFASDGQPAVLDGTHPPNAPESTVADERLADALAQQRATREILGVMVASRNDATPVFETIARAALVLCRASSAVVATYDGALLRLVAVASVTKAGADAIRSLFPRPASRDNGITRAVLSRDVVSIPDVLADPDYATTESAVASGFRSVLALPLLQDSMPIGAISLGRVAPEAFPDAQVALLRTFADQAVIALENVRLFREVEERNRGLAEALEQQTATSDILRVISASRTDVQPVFETIARAALRFCRAEFANVFTFDGSLIHLAAIENANTDYVEKVRALFPRPPGRGTAVERAIATGRVCIIPDVLADPDYVIAAAAAISGYRSVLAVPLMRDGRPIGTIAVGRPVAGPFPDPQVALMQTFADQAVIAIENGRLLVQLEQRNRDLVESLEQQTATSEVLRVMSRSRSDVQPVFDAIASAAMSLCSASSANVVTYDGRLVHVASVAATQAGSAGALREHFRTYPRPPSRDTANCRAVLTRSVVAIPDVLCDPDYKAGGTAVAAGYRSVLAVPLVAGQGAMGAITVARPEAGPFPDKQVALLQTFADQAVIAIENVRLFGELQARTAELTRSVDELRALGEISQAVNSTLDLETVLSTIVARATQLTGMDGGTIYEFDEDRGEFHLHTADRLPDELVAALRAHPIRRGEGALGRMAIAGAPVQIADIVAEGAYQSRVRDLLVRLGYRALLAVPLMRDEHLLGGLAVNRKAPGPFGAEEIALLETFAAQSALAIQNARLFRELEVKGRALEQASRHKSEFLANMSHELRTPLNAIIGFSEVLAERMFGDINDKQAEYLGDILESARHLLALINDVLDLSKIEAGKIELDLAEIDVARALDNTLLLVRERAQRRSLALIAAIAPDLGAIVADERKFKQVVLNLLSNAIKFTPQGGTITLRAIGVGDGIEVSVRDTGVGISAADQVLVFEEFRQVGATDRRSEGTGLGLAISRRFVLLHGGSIRVDSEVGRGSTFTVRLPRRPPDA